MFAEIVPLSEPLARAVAQRLRPEDELEIVGVRGDVGHAVDSLCQGVRMSVCGAGMLVNGAAAAAGGLVPCDDGAAGLWLLGTPLLDRFPFTMCKAVRAFVLAAEHQWPTMRAISHAENTTHHRWLEWLGFRLVAEAPFGAAVPQHIFRTYQREAPDHV